MGCTFLDPEKTVGNTPLEFFDVKKVAADSSVSAVAFSSKKDAAGKTVLGLRTILVSDFVSSSKITLGYRFGGVEKTAEILLGSYKDQATLTPVKASLYGQWVGLCAYDDNSSSCNLLSRVIGASGKDCPSGFELKEVSSRFQGVFEDSAQPSRRMSACIRVEGGSSVDAAMRADPRNFAVSNNWYGLCFYTVNVVGGKDVPSATCDGGQSWPMNADKTCPAGFSFVHISAQRLGVDSKWLATCVAGATGLRASDAPSGAIQGFCAYDYNAPANGGACTYSKFGAAVSRGNCAAGNSFLPFSGRTNGVNENWNGICMKN